MLFQIIFHVRFYFYSVYCKEGRLHKSGIMEGTDLIDAYNMSPMFTGTPAQHSQQQQQAQQQQGNTGGRKSTPIGQLQHKAAEQQQHFTISDNEFVQPSTATQNNGQYNRAAGGNSGGGGQHGGMVVAQRQQDAPVFYDPRDIVPQTRAVVQPYLPAVRYPAQEAQRAASYFDAMVQKRRDVLKMVSFAIIILLAISIHTVVDFGLKELIMSNDFTFKQEIGVRMIYPLVVILLLWNLKAITWTGR